MESMRDSAFYCQLLLDEDRLRVLGALAMQPGTVREVAEWPAEKFELGVTYPGRTVNEMLRQRHEDYATLRRYLVDAGLLQREQGVYWRTGEDGPEVSG